MSTKGHKKKHVCALTHSLPFIGNKSSSPLTFTIQPVWKMPSLESINTPLAQTASPPPPRPTPTTRPPFLFSPLTLDSPSSFHPTSPFAIITTAAQQAAVGRLQRLALMVRRLDAPCNVSHDSEDGVWRKMLHVKLDNYA